MTLTRTCVFDLFMNVIFILDIFGTFFDATLKHYSFLLTPIFIYEPLLYQSLTKL